MPASSAATKAKILATARRLLNERGVLAVTVRLVAAELGISHGNLCYHFPNMSAVVEALYDSLVAESNAQIAAVPRGQPPLALILRLQSMTFELMIKYRFLFLDYVAIFRAHPRLRQHLLKLKEQRTRQFKGFLQWLVAERLMKTERYPGQFDLLFRQYDLMIDFWISQAEIVHPGGTAAAKPEYQRVCFALFLPHLTARGRAQYEAAQDQLT